MAKARMFTEFVETRFWRLRRPPALGERINGWRVCWLGGWDKGHFRFVVMVERRLPQPRRILIGALQELPCISGGPERSM